MLYILGVRTIESTARKLDGAGVASCTETNIKFSV